MSPTTAQSAQRAPAAEAEPSPAGHGPARSRADLGRLCVGALGVVFGDIGTSPLYAIKECVNGRHAVTPEPGHVLGLVSLVFWALFLIVCIKYLIFVMRCDNRGEGGILALHALLGSDPTSARSRGRQILMLLGLFGAGLLCGEGVITPAISVLSAVEGLHEAAPGLGPIVVPATLAILAVLFLVQRQGTARVGSVFGPVMFVWFGAIGILGLAATIKHPQVMLALSPHYAVMFIVGHGTQAFFLLGSVILAVTGAEALYADMGHFGVGPIRIAWWALVFPALILCYLGQGAILLTQGAAATANPFYALTGGSWLIYPMIVVATAAAVIASQALISGVYSIIRQAIQLGYWPRMRVVHTSGSQEGQIYVPAMNWAMMIACLLLVAAFRSSSALAAAYGMAVTGVMTITSISFYAVARSRWKWPRARIIPLVALFLFVDLSFLSATLPKLLAGGWVPLVIGGGMFLLMTTWRRGRSYLAKQMAERTLPLDLFLEDLPRAKPVRVPGNAVFMTSGPEGVPPVLLHHLKHLKVLHEKVILLSVVTDPVPAVRSRDRAKVTDHGHGIYRVVLHYGFMQYPNVPDALGQCRKQGLALDLAATSYFLGRETLLSGGRAPMSGWRKAVFSFMSRNAPPATSFFRLPPNRVVELGVQLEM